MNSSQKPDSTSDSKTESATETVWSNIRRTTLMHKQAALANGIELRVASGFSRFAGTMRFAAVHLGFVAAWIAANLGAFAPLLQPFDPPPFSFLSTAMCGESLFLAIVILAKQNRMAEIERAREEFALQLALLTELETTHLLRILDQIATRLHISVSGSESSDLEELKSATSPEALMRAIEAEQRESAKRAD